MTSLFNLSKNNNDFISYFINNNQALFSDISSFLKTTKNLNFKNIQNLFENKLSKKIKKKYNYLIGVNTDTNKINLINIKNSTVVTIDYNFTEYLKNKEFQISNFSIRNNKTSINNSNFILKTAHKSLNIDFSLKDIYFNNNIHTMCFFDEYSFYISHTGLSLGGRNIRRPQSQYIATPSPRNTVHENSTEQRFIKENFLDICDCLLTKNKTKLEDIININNLIYDSNYVLDYINESFFEIVKWDS